MQSAAVDGSISVDEIAAVMKLMGSDPTESEIRDMVNQVRCASKQTVVHRYWHRAPRVDYESLNEELICKFDCNGGT